MKTVQYQEPCGKNNNFLPVYYKHFYKDSRLLFFDIETTGFSAKNTTLYLIGALWYETDSIHILQWFNEDGYSEKEIISTFENFCKNFTHLVTFNGLGFDIPYLRQKAEILGIPFHIDKNPVQIDIFKEIRSYRKIFMLDNMKQVSIEKYLGIDRQDIYSGKELIQIYQSYIARPDDKKEHLLLLHNHDDLLGMPGISQILNYKAFFEHINVQITECKTEDNKFIIIFTCNEAASLPKRISLSQNGIFLNAFEQRAVLHIPVFKGTLKYYFKDYKNYYYLPKEDLAIHKSVAAYAEPENRMKATKNTCYTKKEGCFIPCPCKEFHETFRTDLSDQKSYITLEAFEASDITAKQNYIKNTLQIFL